MTLGQLDLALHIPDETCVLETAPSLKISIVTGCRDNASTIEGCLSSVAGQTFRNVEHVVVDRHSKDDSPELIYAQRDRLSIVYGGVGETRFEAWNRGIGQATGDVLGFVDAADELASPDVLERVAQAFANPWVSAVYGDILCVDAQDARHVVRHHNVGACSRERLSLGLVPPTTALFVRRSWYRRIGGFAPELKLAADYDASLRLFSHQFFKAVYLERPVVRQRLVFPEVRQLPNALRIPIEELRSLRSARVGGWKALAWHNLSKVGRWL
ncbi:glycosyltransferase [Hydrogenophaga sp. BPS33]|uniref:glycosyltransferase n=1 Tax=Hydrogenophaga sp. BPS33 TaxID=2651974 RepID=UPI00131F4A9F|nr:glycosyltransferase [Hydrogenophaga sp. BPS33]QHE87163.1 glycosyltransferase [Hydrogenophaga sp. BPS33]